VRKVTMGKLIRGRRKIKEDKGRRKIKE